MSVFPVVAITTTTTAVVAHAAIKDIKLKTIDWENIRRFCFRSTAVATATRYTEWRWTINGADERTNKSIRTDVFLFLKPITDWLNIFAALWLYVVCMQYAWCAAVYRLFTSRTASKRQDMKHIQHCFSPCWLENALSVLIYIHVL